MPFLNRTGTTRSIVRAVIGCPQLLTESTWDILRPVEKRWLRLVGCIHQLMAVRFVVQRFTSTNRYG